MTLKVDTDKIKDNEVLLYKYLNDFKGNNFAIFNEFSSLENYWHGEDKDAFMEKIKKEEKNIEEIISRMDEIYNVINDIINFYDLSDRS